MIVIPASGSAEHVEDNRQAVDLLLDNDDLGVLGRAFPPPSNQTLLKML